MIRKTIWLNHWFSTAYNIINLIRQDKDIEFKVIGSNENEVSVLKAVCDEWYSEPDKVSDVEYVDFCLEFCKEHEVDVFLPHRHFQTISKYKNRFEDIGVSVVVDDYSVVELLNDKKKAYSFFAEQNYLKVPEHYVVQNIDDFRKAYNDLVEKYDQVCTKFVHDEGGKSYRLIDNTRKGYAALFKKQNTRMTLDQLEEALMEREQFSPLMVMPYLEGDEISVDCLKTEQGLIAIPRIKSITRFERIEFDQELIDVCGKIYESVSLEMPCNIQFKYRKGIPYFLEINTRMSGGLHMACAATGVNIPDIAVNKAMGKNIAWTLNKESKFISQVEIPVVL